MMRLLSALILLPLFVNGQLKEFDVIKMEQPDVPVIQANTQFPDDALILVYSSLGGLQFRSSLGGVDKQSYNATAGRYELLVKPLKQMVFVAKKGFIESKIATINPSAKDVVYCRVEKVEADMNKLDAAALKKLLDEGVITIDQYSIYQRALKEEDEKELAIDKGEGIDSVDDITCADIDGNKYFFTRIGKQIWMSENLNVTKFRDGSSIQSQGNARKWSNSESPVYRNSKKNNPDWMSDSEIDSKFNKVKSGKIYNWWAVADERGLCPEGWRVPTKWDVEELVRSLGKNNLGSQLKTSRNNVWRSASGSLRALNTSGFAALPVYSINESGKYDESNFARWWTSSSARESGYYYSLSSSSNSLIRASKTKNWGMSVRCIKE